jgi:hypothetical protein
MFEALLERTVNRGFNAAYGMGVPWLLWHRSILGDREAIRIAPPGFETELAAFQPLWSPASLGTLLRVGPSYPLLRRLIRERCGPIAFPGDCVGKHPEQRWFFINGVCADRRLARFHAAALCRAFRRPFTILYSPTEGFAFDLLGSVIAKGGTIVEAAACNFAPLVEALIAPEVERVIVICHSQGAIVAAVLLKALEELLPQLSVQRSAGTSPISPERRVARQIVGRLGAVRQPESAKAATEKARDLTSSEIGKLELYCFANCATSMEPFVSVGMPRRRAPWIESYGNEYDMVARLGVLAPPHGMGSARIDGDRYRRNGMWGHLFNAHYLLPMLKDVAGATPPENELKPFHNNLLQRPRLWEYLDGKTPPPP